MKKRILALDMGGTSVKAGLFYRDEEEKETSWEHNYRDCGLKKAKADLITRIKKFSTCKVDAVGLSVAGLIATDNSLYRSTVLTSFTGFNIPEFLRQELGVEVVTIDNDADCGAMGEWHNCRKRFFYVVVGSGIGSAYINYDGRLPYLTRLDPKHKFSDKDNPIPNDLGLQVALPKTYIYKKFKEFCDVDKEKIDKVLKDKNGKPLRGPNNSPNSIRVGKLGSATGLKNIIDILLFGQDFDTEDYYQNQISRYLPKGIKINLKDFSNEKKIAKMLSLFAHHGEPIAQQAFKLFGHFLGYGIAKATKVIRSQQRIYDTLEVRLSGQIMGSADLFEKETRLVVCEGGGNCHLKLASSPYKTNLQGAYLRAAESLKKKGEEK